MDPWQQSVEDRLGKLNDKMDTQLKWLLIAFASGFVLLGGLILNRTDALATRLDTLGDRIAHIEATGSNSVVHHP